MTWNVREHLRLARFVVKWLALSGVLGAAVGSAVAFFLWSLDEVTLAHGRHPWLLYFLPLAGALSGLVYQRWGREVEGGNNLIIEQIHEPGGGVPGRLAPLVLGGTLLTHLFGGSAGREGTAVQMGGSLAGTLGAWLRLDPDEMRLLLMAGVAAGFGAVFGTPLAGAIFALEVLTIGRMDYRGLIPCVIAALVGDRVTTAWGIAHTHYVIEPPGGEAASAAFDGLRLAKVALAATIFGLASVLFAELTHGVNRLGKRLIAIPWLRPAAGGAVIVALVWLLGRRDYLGLGVVAGPGTPDAVTIVSCFRPEGAEWLSWWWKLLFTAVTVGSGFKGGEVTPLFFIGAALGHVLGVLLGVPVDWMAGIGFVAVFAGATNTPLACTIMAVELFAPGREGLLSAGFAVDAAVACFLAYFMSGHSSIYTAQRREA